MNRVFVPRAAFEPKARVMGLQDGMPETVSWVTETVHALIGFLTKQHPRGPIPMGPVSESATMQAYAVVVKWRNEASSATVDYFVIYRASAGTVASPFTPTFADAAYIDVIPTARLPRQLPPGSFYCYCDMDFSAADITNEERFQYWVTSVDNEFRESAPVPIGVIVTLA